MYETAFTGFRRAHGIRVDADGASPHVRYHGDGDAHAALPGDDTAVCGVRVTWRHTPPQSWPPVFRRSCHACEMATLSPATAAPAESPPVASATHDLPPGGPLFMAKYVVLEFDEEAGTVRIYHSRSYPDRDPERAIHDAGEAARAATDAGLPLRYAVASLAGLRAIPPSREQPADLPPRDD